MNGSSFFRRIPKLPVEQNRMIFALSVSVTLHLTLIFFSPETHNRTQEYSANAVRVKPIEVRIFENSREQGTVRSETNEFLPSPIESIQAKSTIANARRDDDAAKFAMEIPDPTPVFAIEISPRFPLPLLAKGLRGSVSAVFQVERDGKIVNIEITQSQPPGIFDSAAIEAISSARVRSDTTRPGLRLGVTIIFDPAGIQATHQLPAYK